MLKLQNFIPNILNFVIPNTCLYCKVITNHNDQQGICGSCLSKLSFITAPYCITCGKPFAISIHNDAVCGQCIYAPPKYDKARSLLKFDEYSKNIIHLFKYHDKTLLSKFFTKLIFARYGSDIQNNDLICPVPMHRVKRIYRGYNQSQIFAHEIGRVSNILTIPDLLIKSKYTKSQITLSKTAREKNIKGSIIFNQRYNKNIKGKTVILIDDVHTTGTTSNVCANLLKKNGATKVTLLTIAMT